MGGEAWYPRAHAGAVALTSSDRPACIAHRPMRGFQQFCAARMEKRFLIMARPKGRQLPNRVSVALTDQQLTALESLARESQAAVSWVIRRAVAEYLERNRPPAATDVRQTTHAPVTENVDETGEHQL
jgi:predicted transcriptional regulator